MDSLEELEDYVLRYTSPPDLTVSTSPIQVLIGALAIGIIVTLFLTYLIYLFIRLRRDWKAVDDEEKAAYQSKADRPIWILLLLISGTTWIVSMLFYSGGLIVVGETGLACSFIRFIGLYCFGFPLWTSLVLYKLVRKYFQFRVSKRKAPHAALTVLVLWIPFLLAAATCLYFDEAGRREDGQCTNSIYCTLPSHILILIHFILFVYLITKIRRTIGSHHEVIRYSIFLSTSFLFPLLDSLFSYIPLFRDFTWTDEVLLVITMLLVLGNMTHLFVLVFRGKRRRRGSRDGVGGRTAILGYEDENNLPPKSPAILSLSSLSSLPSQPEDGSNLPDMDHLFGGNTHLQAVMGPVLTRARRPGGTSSFMMPDFEQFIQRMPPDMAAEVDPNRGLFSSQPQLPPNAIKDEHLDRAEKYLK